MIILRVGTLVSESRICIIITTRADLRWNFNNKLLWYVVYIYIFKGWSNLVSENVFMRGDRFYWIYYVSSNFDVSFSKGFIILFRLNSDII